jgi:hypothetical protein
MKRRWLTGLVAFLAAFGAVSGSACYGDDEAPPQQDGGGGEGGY